MRKTCGHILCAVGATAITCGLIVGRANGVVAGYETSDNRLPSPQYSSSNGVAYATSLGTYLINAFMQLWPSSSRIPELPAGTFQICVVPNSTYQVGTTYNGMPAGGQSTAAVQVRVEALPPSLPGVRPYDTEMLQLDISDLPGGAMLRESPTLQSTGHTTVTDLPGGTFRIDSFFDVFTELSLDGGQSWTPSSGPLHLQGDLPEPGSMVICAFAAAGALLRRQRSR